MYNKITMVGNLTRDIEIRYMPNGSALAKSAIATSHRYKTNTGEQKEEVCFLDFNVFGRSAEVANQYLKKGSRVLLEGRLIFEQWTAQDGTSRSKHALRVDTLKMLDTKTDSQNAGGGNNQAGYNNPQGNYQQPQQNQYNQYNQPSQNNRGNHVDSNQYNTSAQQIPEIDIDDDEIF